jgi:acetylornithine/succinyldiaminopimelate/putrescine aminotransferase
MVYGEYIESPQVMLAKKLADLLPPSLSSVYLVNSGAEAVEGAIKLSRRYTGRTEIISFENAYHGSTTGALAIGGNESLKNAFRPLLPGTRLLKYNDASELENITTETAAVFIEPIQGEAGVRVPGDSYLQKLRERCNETGKLFCFEHSKVTPDILLLSKSFGGGMPLGAFISSTEIMTSLSSNPVLGHITTFGGHPVSCAAALAALEELTGTLLMQSVAAKEKLFREKLQHPLIQDIRGKGLFLALQFSSEELNRKLIHRCIEAGVITDWFLFAPDCLRFAPPLIITEEEIEESCSLILHTLNQIEKT